MYQNAHFWHKLSGLGLTDLLEIFRKGRGNCSATSIEISTNLLHTKLLNRAANEQKTPKSAKKDFYHLLITVIKGAADGGDGPSPSLSILIE